MRNSRVELRSVLKAGGGVVRRRDYPRLVDQIDWLVRRGLLLPVLPGVYAEPERARDFDVRVRAAMLWDRDAILCGRAAARATFWPKVPVDEIELALPRKRQSVHGYRVIQRRIPPDLLHETGGVRSTSPALTALDLSVDIGGEAIDTVLRTRAATLTQLHEALAPTPSRRGNAERRTLLLDSRGRPWSEAERAMHRILRAAGITGWKGNWGLEMLTGVYWIDVAFPKLKLAVEVDSWEFHNTPEAFENDRWRQNDLVLAGWRVLRFTAVMIRDHPLVVLRTIEQALVG